MMCHLRIVSLCLLFWLPGMAVAQSALIFERTQIDVTTLSKTGDTPQTVRYEVELRPEDSLRLEYIHTLNTLTPQGGVLIGLVAPAMVPLPAMKVYTPVDALLIAEDGTVLQIAPGVTLGEMTQPIQAKGPIKGILFLKAGEAAARGLHPQRSVVAAKIFMPTPHIQE